MIYGSVLAGIVALIDNCHCTVTVEEVWVASIDVACLHGDQISYQLVCWFHGAAEESYYFVMEFLLELWISSE